MYHHGAVTDADLDGMENEQLALLAQNTGDDDKRIVMTLLRRNKGYIHTVWSRYRPFIPVEDLPGLGYLATDRAVKNFTPSKGGTFLTCLDFELRTEFRKAVSECFLVQISDNVTSLVRCYLDGLQCLESQDIPVTNKNIMSITGLSSEDLQTAIRAHNARSCTSLDIPIRNGDGETDLTLTLGDTVEDDQASSFAEDVERRADQDALQKVFSEMVKEMPEDVQAVIMYRLLGATVAEIAKIMHCEAKDIRRLQKQAEKRLSRPGNKDRLMQYIESTNLFIGTGEMSFRQTETSSPERTIIHLYNTDND